METVIAEYDAEALEKGPESAEVEALFHSLRQRVVDDFRKNRPDVEPHDLVGIAPDDDKPITVLNAHYFLNERGRFGQKTESGIWLSFGPEMPQGRLKRFETQLLDIIKGERALAATAGINENDFSPEYARQYDDVSRIIVAKIKLMKDNRASGLSRALLGSTMPQESDILYINQHMAGDKVEWGISSDIHRPSMEGFVPSSVPGGETVPASLGVLRWIEKQISQSQVRESLLVVGDMWKEKPDQR